MFFHFIVYKSNHENALAEATAAALALNEPYVLASSREIGACIEAGAGAGYDKWRAWVFGGDGTMLSAARAFAGQPATVKEIVGIHRGNLGFLTSFDQLSRWADEDVVSDVRHVLSIEVIQNNETIFQGKALNDLVLDRGTCGVGIRFKVTQGEKHVFSLRGDGIIIATPTGSTAYSLAAHGPLIYPDLPCLILNPFNVHSLNSRPVIVSNSSPLYLSAEDGGDIHLDGQVHRTVAPGDVVKISVMDEVTLIHPKSYNWFSRLRDKFNWSA